MTQELVNADIEVNVEQKKDVSWKLRLKSALAIGLTFIILIMWVQPVYYALIMLVGICCIIEWNKMVNYDVRNSIIGALIIMPPMACLMETMHHLEKKPLGVLLYFLMIWATDIFAMIGGKMIGGQKLAPQISPNKTWSGFATGVFAAGVVAQLMCILFPIRLEDIFLYKINFFLIGMLFGIFAQLSDLFISIFKRKHNVKDFGNTIPGHGGVLDRFDSVILTAPLMVFMLY